MEVSYIRSNSYLSQKSMRPEEDPNGPKPIPSMLMYVAACVCLIGGIAMGTVVAWSSVALPDMASPHSNPRVTDTESRSFISSLAQLGGCMGSFIGGPLCDLFGRKRLIIGGVIPWLIGNGVIFVANSAALIMLGRWCTGLAAGLICSGIPMYLCEISVPRIRGLLGSSFETTITVGMFYVTVVGVNVTWQWLSTFCVIPLAFLAVLMPFMPESPIWLAGCGRKDDAHAALQRLRSPDSDLDGELMAIDASFDVSTPSIESGSTEDELGWFATQLALWKRPDAWKPLCFGFCLAAFQQFCGLTGLLFYQKDILLAANMNIDENIATVSIFTTQMICTLAASFIIDRLGRRPLLIFSSAVQSVCLLVLGFYFRFPGWFAVNGLSFIPVVFMLTFFIGYSFGQGPVTWCMVGEMAPNFIRGRVASINVAANWLMCFVASQTFEKLIGALTIQGTFWLESATCILSILFTCFILPETKGKTLDEIQRMYTNNKKM